MKHNPCYFVSQHGDDRSGTGTQDNPWQTIHKALCAVPENQSDAAVIIRGGVYKIPATLLFDSSPDGAAKNIRTIAAHEDEEVIIDGSLLTEPFGAMVKISSISNLQLRGLTFENLRGNQSAILVDGNSHHISIVDNVLRMMTWVSANNLDENNPSPSDNLNPIAVVGNHPTEAITHIEVSRNKLHNIVPGYSEGIKIVGNVTDFVVSNNHVHDIANIGIVAAGNYKWVTDSSGTCIPDEVNQARNGIITKNTVHDAVSPVANSAGIYLDGARNVTVSENTSYNNSVGFSIGCEQPGNARDNRLTNNVAYDNTDAGIVIGTITQNATVENTEVSHNEFRNNYSKGGYGGEMTIQKTNDLKIHHNRFCSSSDIITIVSQPAANLTCNDNQYYSASKNPDNAVFDWGGISGISYIGMHKYQTETQQDSRSLYKKGKPRKPTHARVTKPGFIKRGLRAFRKIPDDH